MPISRSGVSYPYPAPSVASVRLVRASQGQTPRYWQSVHLGSSPITSKGRDGSRIVTFRARLLEGQDSITTRPVQSAEGLQACNVVASVGTSDS